MPKVIDREQKKQEIVYHAWVSVHEAGMKGMSVRKIAEAAGISAGQMRYYFPDQETLLSAVMDYVKAKVEKRIKDIIAGDGELKDKIIAAILATMPLDKDRYADMEVWTAFQHSIHELNTDTMQDDIRRLVEMSLHYLEQTGQLKHDLNKERVILKTTALIDGLAMHKLWSPNQVKNTDVEALITLEVESWMEE